MRSVLRLFLGSVWWTGCAAGSVELDEKPVGAHDGETGNVPADTSTGDSEDSGRTDTGPEPDTGEDTAVDTDTTGETGDSDTTSSAPGCFAFGVEVADALELVNGASVDSFDAALGAYGGANVGTEATIAVSSAAACALTVGGAVGGDLFVLGDPDVTYCETWGADVSGSINTLSGAVGMPIVAEPTGMPGSSGSKTLGWGQAESWGADARFDKLDLQYGSVVDVTADLRVRAASATLAGTLTIAAGRTLDLYVDDALSLPWGALVNASGSPGQLRVWSMGDEGVQLAYGGTLGAQVVAPEGAFQQGGTFSGAVAARTFVGSWGALTHVDTSLVCP